MEFKILNLNSASSSTTLLKETPLFLIQDLVQSNSILEAKVLEGLRGKNIYLIEMNGKQFKLQSETKLLKNEALKLNVNRASSQTQLEIISRSTSSLPVSSSLESVWTKNYFSPVQVLSKSFESAQSDVSVQKLVQLLDVFLPGLEWKEDTLCFDWKFADGEANGFLGKRKESFGFYFHYSSKILGNVDSNFLWKKSDLSDLVLHLVFDKLNSYLRAYENLPEFKKMLSSNSIFPTNILFHYFSSYNTKGNWVA